MKTLDAPSENCKVTFTDIYGKTHDGEYILDENIFCIGFESSCEFRFSFEVVNWSKID